MEAVLFVGAGPLVAVEQVLAFPVQAVGEVALPLLALEDGAAVLGVGVQLGFQLGLFHVEE